MQLNLLPQTIRRLDPCIGQSADSLGVGVATSGQRYVLKATVPWHPQMPASEWICHALAKCMNLAIPHWEHCVLPDGRDALGSRIEGNVLEREFFPSARPTSDNPEVISGTYVLDLFVANADRHKGQWLLTEAGGGTLLRPIDFSRAWFKRWPLPIPPFGQGATMPSQENDNSGYFYATAKRHSAIASDEACCLGISAIPTKRCVAWDHCLTAPWVDRPATSDRSGELVVVTAVAYADFLDQDAAMTPQPLHFSLIRYQPDMQRQEVVNVGVVVFTASGPIVALAPNQGKLLALDPNFRLTRLYAQGEQLQASLRSLWEESPAPTDLIRMFGTGGAISISPTGMLDAQGRSVESIVDELQHDLVLAPVRSRTREKQTSRLHSELRQLFKQGGILGSRPDDISKHLVVPNFPIDPDIGLFAEFALRNGKLHVTETVDFRTSTPSVKRQEAQAKTLLLVEALERLGSTDLRRYVVVTGASSQVQASMNLLERYSDEFVVRESAQDWQRYVDAIHSAARPTGLSGSDA